MSGAVVWLTGLPGSGKSTLAMALERRFFDLGWQAYTLDGDNVRRGLNADLGLLTRAPPGKHTTHRRGRGAVRRCGNDLHHRIHLAVPRRPRAGAKRRRCAALFRGSREFGPRDLRAARSQRALPQGARRIAEGLHRRRRAVRIATESPISRSTPSRRMSTRASGSCSRSSSRPAGGRRQAKSGRVLRRQPSLGYVQEETYGRAPSPSQRIIPRPRLLVHVIN